MACARVADEVFRDFFRDVLERHLYEFQVEDYQFATATAQMRWAYLPKANFCANQPFVDYDSPQARCAYLHRYAAIHCSLIQSVLLQNKEHFETISQQNNINFCCLGGGPGTDVVGLAAALSCVAASTNKIYRITTVDCMEGWFFTHRTIYNVAAEEKYGLLGKFLKNCISSFFICDDILSPSLETIGAIRRADLLTMIKFISEVPSEFAPEMLKRIIRWMKPKALFLFVDNSGGGFYETVCRAANESELVETGTSFRDVQFESKIFHPEIFNLDARSSLRVTVKMWRKPQST